MSSTRSKAKKTPEISGKITHNKQCDTKVFFLDGSLVSGDCDDVEIISLRNPCTEAPTRYLHAKHLNRIYEILNFAEEPRSWFIDDMAYANGSIFMTTIFDPLFFALHYLQLNSSSRCLPFDQAVVDDNFPHTHLLTDLVSVEELSMIANQKGDKSLKAFQYDEPKALKWLSIKCKRLSNELQAKKFHIGAKSAYFVKSEKFDNSTGQKVEGEFLAYAFGILCEYVPKGLVEKLSIHLGLEKINPLKRKSLGGLEHKALKRVKSQEDLNFDIDTKPVIVMPERKISAKEKSLEKAARGSKSISSFFTKK